MVMEEKSAEVLPTNAIHDANSAKHHDELEQIVVINRLSKFEQDIRILFQKLDQITGTMDSVVQRQNRMQTNSNKIFERLQ